MSYIRISRTSYVHEDDCGHIRPEYFTEGNDGRGDWRRAIDPHSPPPPPRAVSPYTVTAQDKAGKAYSVTLSAAYPKTAENKAREHFANVTFAMLYNFVTVPA